MFTATRAYVQETLKTMTEETAASADSGRRQDTNHLQKSLVVRYADNKLSKRK